MLSSVAAVSPLPTSTSPPPRLPQPLPLLPASGAGKDSPPYYSQHRHVCLPPPIKCYFTDVHLFCLYKDTLDKSKLRPLGIPTAIRRPPPDRQPCRPHLPRKVCPSHDPLQICHWNPKWNKPYHQHNDNAKTTSGKIYISLPQSTGILPSRAAVLFDLTNQFNSVSREAFFKVIADSFPEILPLTTLFYKQAGTVNHKWADGTWRTLLMLMEEGVNQGCPLSPIFASLVVANLLQPLDIELRERAATRLQNGNPGDDGFTSPIFLVTSTASPSVYPSGL